MMEILIYIAVCTIITLTSLYFWVEAFEELSIGAILFCAIFCFIPVLNYFIVILWLPLVFIKLDKIVIFRKEKK